MHQDLYNNKNAKHKKMNFVVVVLDQFWHFIAAYELFVLFFSSVLSSCTLSHVASLRMRRIFNSLDRSCFQKEKKTFTFPLRVLK